LHHARLPYEIPDIGNRASLRSGTRSRPSSRRCREPIGARRRFPHFAAWIAVTPAEKVIWPSGCCRFRGCGNCLWPPWCAPYRVIRRVAQADVACRSLANSSPPWRTRRGACRSHRRSFARIAVSTRCRHHTKASLTRLNRSTSHREAIGVRHRGLRAANARRRRDGWAAPSAYHEVPCRARPAWRSMLVLCRLC
jgi:hypothetical protein